MNKKIIIITVGICFSICFILFIFNGIKKEEIVDQINNDENLNNSESFVIPEVEEYKFIDMNNTDNVKIKDGIKFNISKKVSEVHEYKQYKFENMKISSSSSTQTSYLEFTITNLAVVKENHNYQILLTILDKNGEKLLQTFYAVPNLEIGESMVDTVSFPCIDVANAADYYFSMFMEDYEN